MKTGDPYTRSALEMQILGRLSDIGHAVPLRELVAGINPDQEMSIICTVFDFKEEGLVTVRELDYDGSQMVALTPQGKGLLLAIYSGRTPCD